MKLLTIKRTPGCPPSGVYGVFMAELVPAHAALMVGAAQRQWRHRNGGAVRVQTVITDVPGPRSALPSVRRT
jgi:hypothetical protein